MENTTSGESREILVHPNLLVSDLMIILDREFPDGGKILPTFIGKNLTNHLDVTLYELGITDHSKISISVGSLIGGGRKPPCVPTHERKYGGINLNERTKIEYVLRNV